MEIFGEILVRLMVCCAAAAVIGGVLRVIFGKTLLVRIYFWLIPGVMLTVVAGYIAGRAVDPDLSWANITAPIGVLILTGNFIIMGNEITAA